MTQRRTCPFFVGAMLVLLWSGTAFAQGSQVTITGVVRDMTGAALPGATVTATSRTANVSQSAVTAGDGSYAISVPSGTYDVTATLSGFRRVARTVDVTASADNKTNFTLQVGLNEQVTVTAMKREEQLIDVPMSVAAPTEEVLRSRGVENLEGVAANVGGFTVQNLGPGQSQVAIRGLSAGQIVRDQPGVKEQVGVYLDESVVSMSLFTPDIDLFDTDRIEVLRGPQGTLFGAGSESGTVRYITNQPELHVTNGSAEFDGTTVQHGNAGGNAKLAINVPLGDNAALRIASYYDRQPGFITAIQPAGGPSGPPTGAASHINDGYRSGARVAVKVTPNKRLTITPRIFYQRNDANGWNRNDTYNILANPFTTTRTPVTLGSYQQYTQLQEKYTDNFALGDVNIDYQVNPNLVLTAVTSYDYRDILVVRDAGALTSSITGGSIGLPSNVYTLTAPLNDATTAKTWTQELRLTGQTNGVRWVGGGFFSHQNRHYGQNLPVTGFTAATGIPTQGLRAPTDSLFWSDLDYTLDQFAAFGEATVPVTPSFSVTGGLRFYHFNEDKAQIFDGIFGNDNNGVSLVSQPGTTSANGVAPRVIASYKLSESASVNAQVSRGFRLGGINDPLNVPLCTPQDLVTFGGRQTWNDETTWNYEAGVKSRLPNGKGALSVAAFYMDIHDLQATVTAGSCSSRLIFNVPKARSQGVEAEFELAPTRNVDFALSTSFNDSTLRSTLTSTDAQGNVGIVGGIQSGRRLPTVPRFQSAEAATFQWEVMTASMAYITATHQFIGSRFTQLGDQDLGTLNLLSFGANTIGAPLTQSVFTYNPELPAYNIENIRVGVRHGRWDLSAFVNNLADERALLSFDQERGTRARIGYLLNQPRTVGVSLHTVF